MTFRSVTGPLRVLVATLLTGMLLWISGPGAVLEALTDADPAAFVWFFGRAGVPDAKAFALSVRP